MAFTATMSTAVGIDKPFSQGPSKKQYFTWTCVSGDSTGTITIPGLTNVSYVQLGGGPITFTAAPTFSGNVITLAFTDPAANRFGSGFAVGT